MTFFGQSRRIAPCTVAFSDHFVAPVIPRPIVSGGVSTFLRKLKIGLLTACAIPTGAAMAQQLPASAFQTYSAADASAIQAGPFSLYTGPVDQLQPTQMNEGFTAVDAKTNGLDITQPSQLQASLLGDIEPVVIGPGGTLYLTDGHHTFTALEDSSYGSTDPVVYVNVIANYSGDTTAQFWAQMQSSDLLLPLNNGVPQTVNTATGSPIPTTLQGLTQDAYRGLEYSILKNKDSKLFTTTSNIAGVVGSSIPGVDKETGLYADFINADAYRNANGGLGLPYLSPGDIQLATQWNLNPNSVTSLPNIGTVTVGQLPGFILPANGSITISTTISNATLATGTLAANGTFTGITQFNLGTPSNPILVGTPQSGFVMQLGNDLGGTVTLSGTNTYSGGTMITAGDLIIATDAALGASPPLTNAAFNSSLILNSQGYTTNALTAVQADNGIIFNSLTEGNGTLTIGTTTGGTFSTSRPIAIESEAATINVNGNVVTLNGPLISAGTNDTGLSNADGEAPLTIDDLSANGGCDRHRRHADPLDAQPLFLRQYHLGYRGHTDCRGDERCGARQYNRRARLDWRDRNERWHPANRGLVLSARAEHIPRRRQPDRSRWQHHELGHADRREAHDRDREQQRNRRQHHFQQLHNFPNLDFATRWFGQWHDLQRR